MKEAEANGIRLLQQAEADALVMLKNSNADESVLRLKSFEALTKVANGQATKIIVPAELNGVATLGTALSEIVKK